MGRAHFQENVGSQARERLTAAWVLFVKTIRTPTILFTLLCLGFLMYVNQTSSLLPERLATHFGAGGQPNGWMSRSGYTTFISLFGMGLPLFVIAICFLCRFLPSWTVNIPNREYWLSPERRSRTYAYLLAHSLWFGCLLVGFVAGMHYLTIQANRSVPVHLATGPMITVLAIFLGGLAIWLVALVRHFQHPV